MQMLSWVGSGRITHSCKETISLIRLVRVTCGECFYLFSVFVYCLLEQLSERVGEFTQHAFVFFFFYVLRNWQQ